MSDTHSSLSQLNQPFVSVLIPVFNDSDRLQKCLAALEKQTYEKHLYEVIVIDNDSSEDIQKIVDCFEKATICFEPAAGSYAARNKGITLAKGNIIAFTDADCIPSTDWIEQGVDSFITSANCGLAGGKINLFFRDSIHPTAVELYESVEMNFHQDVLLTEQQYALTANLFTSKQILETVGCFDQDLKSGGDREWGQRVFAAGYTQAYAPKALVQHPARYSFWQLYKRVTRINGGNIDAQKAAASKWDSLKSLSTDLTLAITPPGKSVLSVWSRPTEGQSMLTTNTRKIQFVLAAMFVRYISAWERIRLRLGGRSRRW